eukprot:CAMPEP_0172597774 /NCGR_PEP_ID=MMETSP1068-20121228/17739_1 /TAXON_ID=35684 /ORGANISM="Pseudopedinella elastica, Strain CCMP716" /LENGTH=170 /DNA_ID=CAMNT_0013397371 /DNA_START=9 /DNA_END=521 /DNA_ORIENTATION=+
MTSAITPVAKKIDPMKCMGDWFVQIAIPTAFDRNAHNGMERYEWDEKRKRVKVTYTFNQGSFAGRKNTVYQVGRVHPKSENGTEWQVAPWIGFCYLPSWLPYVVLEVDEENYSYLVASSPSTGGMAPWLYIMTREQVVADSVLEPLKAAAANAGWDMSKSERVPQQKTDA